MYTVVSSDQSSLTSSSALLTIPRCSISFIGYSYTAIVEPLKTCFVFNHNVAGGLVAGGLETEGLVAGGLGDRPGARLNNLKNQLVLEALLTGRLSHT